MNCETTTQLDNHSFDTLLESACAELDRVGRELQAFAGQYNEALRQLQQDNRKQAKALAERYLAAFEVAKQLIDKNRHQFDKPRTRQMFGVVVGLRLGSKHIAFEHSDEKTIALIDQHLPELAHVLAPTTRELMVTPMKKLTKEQLETINARLQQLDQIVLDHDADAALATLMKLAS